MAALNYTVILTDTGNNGSGPYTLAVQKNPTTPASGGTALTIPTQTANPAAISFFEWGTLGLHLAMDNISIANQNDSLN